MSLFFRLIVYSLLLISMLSYICVDTWQRRPDGLLHIYVLDIGQGDAALIQTPAGRYILIDAGPHSYKLQSVLQDIIPWFAKRIDIFVISHPHADHYYGYTDLQTIYPAQLLMLPKAYHGKSYGDFLRLLEINNRYVWADINKDIFIDNITMNTLYPFGGKYSYDYENVNNSSIVQKIEYKNFSMLFTGDIEQEGIKMLVDFYKDALASNVLKASHHGSDNGVSEDFLYLVDPSLITISAGLNNRYQHPHQKTIDLLSSSQRKYLVTSDVGTIEIITDGSWMQVCYMKTKNKICQDKVGL